MMHELKCWTRPFWDVKNGLKTFEYRKNDRDYQVGDFLKLREWDPESSDYTGIWVVVVVTYILYGGRFDIPEDYCIMSVKL